MKSALSWIDSPSWRIDPIERPIRSNSRSIGSAVFLAVVVRCSRTTLQAKSNARPWMSFIGHLHFVSSIDKPLGAAAEDAINAAALELHIPVLPNVRPIAPPTFFNAPRAGADAHRAADLDFRAGFATTGVGLRGSRVGVFIGDAADGRDLHVIAFRFARRDFDRNRRTERAHGEQAARARRRPFHVRRRRG